MVIFTARQNLANLNEVKMNLIVKFANLAGKSYINWYFGNILGGAQCPYPPPPPPVSYANGIC